MGNAADGARLLPRGRGSRLALALLALCAACAKPAEQASPPPSTLIRNALVVDGSGAAAKPASVRIEGARIVAVGDLQRLPGERVIDAAGLALAPGFIDPHSHHDAGLAEHPDALAAVSQGITTIVAGQDGESTYPLNDRLARLKASPVAVNFASFTGHGTLRSRALGADFRRAATDPEVATMKRLLSADMAAGSLGLSTGLEYDPGIYSSPSEVLALAAESARSGGMYISHIRSEDRQLWAALDEIIEIGRRTGMPVQVSHMKLAMVDWWRQAGRFTARLDAARAAGIAISGDVYPYEYWQSGADVLFPERDFTNRATAEFALTSLAPADQLIVSEYKADRSFEGRTVADIAVAQKTDPAAVLMAIASGEPATIIATSMHEDDVADLMRWSHASICSDGSIGGSHPRGAGAFTRVLRIYVREKRVLTLEQAVHKMSGLTAASLGIARRGLIRPGYYADLVLFDPATVGDRATVADPAALSVGLRRVWVNGRIVYADGKASGERPGQFVARASQRPRHERG